MFPIFRHVPEPFDELLAHVVFYAFPGPLVMENGDRDERLILRRIGGGYLTDDGEMIDRPMAITIQD